MREVGILKKDPEQIREQIEKLEMMSKSLSVLTFLIRWPLCLCSYYELKVLVNFTSIEMLIFFFNFSMGFSITASYHIPCWVRTW